VALLLSTLGDTLMARRSAFTLSELLVAVAVIATLSLLLVRAAYRVRDAAARAQSRDSYAVSAEATRTPQPVSPERRLP
jgi:prepilin-type N-terminal cleavage/methylation domain-containing protein